MTLRFSLPLSVCFFVAALAPSLACGPPQADIADDSLEVTHTSPHHGAVEVALEVSPEVGFSLPFDSRSLDEVFLEREEGDDFEAVEVKRFLEGDDHLVVILPRELLEPGTRYQIRVKDAAESESGVAVRAESRSQFVTLDP